jgi:hypothetical protein
VFYAYRVPFIALLVALPLLLVLAVAIVPLSLVMRYRTGTAPQVARGWVATVNVAALMLSTSLFLLVAAVTNVWVPEAFRYTIAGLAAGCLLGLAGLALSRWETTPQVLRYTPNRWLVLAITLMVTSRILYGYWRGWEAWRSGLDQGSWLAAAGAAGSLAAGAIVLGYYLTYWAGVRRRLKQHLRA